MIYHDHAGIVIRDATKSDIEEIARNMRRQDAQEVLAAGCGSTAAALAESLAASTLCLTAERHGVPVAMFGLVPDALLGSRARVWFLGADGLDRIKKTFVRFSRPVISQMLDRYPELHNWVDVRYKGAIRWLKFCGAIFDPPVRGGVNGELFQYFVLRRS